MLKYIHKDTVMHKIDSRIKLPVFIFFMFLQIILPIDYSIFALFLIAAVFYISGFNIIRITAENPYILLIALIPSAFRFFMESGYTIVFGFLIPKSIYYSVLNFAYVYSLFFTAALFTLTTTPANINNALVFYGMPKRLSFIFMISFNSIHFIFKKAKAVIIAQKARGCEKNIIAILVPILHSCFKRARVLSWSLTSRGFDSEILQKQKRLDKA